MNNTARIDANRSLPKCFILYCPFLFSSFLLKERERGRIITYSEKNMIFWGISNLS